MNLVHLKYAVAIAETNSINKAAEKLYVGQSALSRAVKELETGLGIEVFERSAKGMSLTPSGKIFIKYAKSILKQVDNVENMFKNGGVGANRFSISAPRASYIANAFVNFSKEAETYSHTELFYRETNTNETVKNVLSDTDKLGIIRYAVNNDDYYKRMMQDKGLCFEPLGEFRYELVVSEKSKLADTDVIDNKVLSEFTEIKYGDSFAADLPFSKVKSEDEGESINRTVKIFDRASRFELLSGNADTFMWAAPIPLKTLQRYNLVQRTEIALATEYTDLIIYRKEYELTPLDKMFIKELLKQKRNTLG